MRVQRRKMQRALTLAFLPCTLLLMLNVGRFAGADGIDGVDEKWGADVDKQAGFWCPDRCTCSASARIVDCSGRELTSVPMVASSTTRLYLHDNAIDSLERSQFHHLHHLTYLILANNAVSKVEADAFKGLHSLKYLILDRNFITELSTGIFRDLPHLETVSLAHNKLQSLSSDIFTSNRHLSLVNLRGNMLESVDGLMFSHLSELHTLDMQSNGCSGGFLRFLRRCQNLTILRLNENNIVELPPDGLQLPSLQLLYLSRNLIRDLPPRLFQDTYNITKLELMKNFVTKIPRSLFFNTTSLKSILLQRNNISVIEDGAFQSLHKLDIIYLSHNDLEVIPPLIFSNLTALSSLHLEGNQLSSLSDESVTDLPALETLYLQNNHISQISDQAFIRLPQLKYLALYGNELTVESIRGGILNSLRSLIKIQLDVFPCSCNLSYLASWSKRYGVRGLYCISHTGSAISLTQAIEDCHSDSTSEDKPQNYSFYPTSNNVTSSKQNGERNETTYRLEQKIHELQLRVARLEMAIDQSCQRWVCLHHGLRLEAGDIWTESNTTCHCSETGDVECSD